MSLEDLLTPDEKALHDALVSIANQYGKFNEDGSGIWAGYESAEENDEKEIGVKCSNCALYMGGVECEILAFEVEAEGKCRFAVIPDGYVTAGNNDSNNMDNPNYENDMSMANNIGSYFEIPVTGMERAISFYQTLLGIELEQGSIDEYEMAFFPYENNGVGVSGALVKGDVYKPSIDGVFLYLKTDDIDLIIRKAVDLGSEILLEKTKGDSYFVAEIKDSEGNRICFKQDFSVNVSNDGEDISKADINLTPTSGMKSSAARALAWKKEGKRGGTRVGLARANQIVNGTELSESTVARMYSFFSRHEVDKKATGFSAGEEGYPSPGRVAWDLWGGDAGYSWSRAKWASIQRQRENKSYGKEEVKKSLWSGTPFSGLK